MHINNLDLDRMAGVNGLTYQTRQGDALPYFAISNVRNGVFVKVAQYVE